MSWVAVKRLPTGTTMAAEPWAFVTSFACGAPSIEVATLNPIEGTQFAIVDGSDPPGSLVQSNARTETDALAMGGTTVSVADDVSTAGLGDASSVPADGATSIPTATGVPSDPDPVWSDPALGTLAAATSDVTTGRSTGASPLEHVSASPSIAIGPESVSSEYAPPPATVCTRPLSVAEISPDPPPPADWRMPPSAHSPLVTESTAEQKRDEPAVNACAGASPDDPSVKLQLD
ncbi:MAG: hypothetical protein ACR2OO_01720 [Thermomicrobiales bacterium]